MAFAFVIALMGVTASAAQETGNAVCAECHPAIARRYSASPMARSSGSTQGGSFREDLSMARSSGSTQAGSLREDLSKARSSGSTQAGSLREDLSMARSSGSTQAGSFREDLSKAKFTEAGADFSISRSDAGLTMTFERDGLRGDRKLQWFIGSGRIGRSYLFTMDDGFLYQAPVSYYSEDAAWRASPGYQGNTAINLTRAVEPACLRCHASRLQHVAGTQNRFGAQPFKQDGVSCERCHGAGGRHVERMRSAAKGDRAIVNPAKLSPERRDSVCAQCHLTGAARVQRIVRTGAAYQPGDSLRDHVAVFVWSGAANGGGLAVTSHFEKLSYSRCKQASGDTLWCGTCHDPHGDSADQQARVRQRCVGCHTASARRCTADAAARQAQGDVCQRCHMPKSNVRDAEHAVYTDHSIPRRPVEPASGTAAKGELASFWNLPVDPRDTALAYAVVALTEPPVRRQAFEMLSTAQERDPADIAITAQLAQFYDRMGQPQRALPLLERVTKQDPTNTAATINLGTLYAQQGRLEEAIQLWSRALTMNPALTQARLNLAVAQLKQGDREAGVASLRKALDYDPDSKAARELLREAER